jgi:hypothetical protein
VPPLISFSKTFAPLVLLTRSPFLKTSTFHPAPNRFFPRTALPKHAKKKCDRALSCPSSPPF